MRGKLSYFYTLIILNRMEAQGKLHKKFDTQEVGASKFQKREFVLELGGDTQYPQLVKFELTGDRCSQLDSFQPGEKVEISFDLKGREWTNKNGEVVYFNTLSTYKIKSAGNASSTPEPPRKSTQPAENFNTPFSGSSSSSTDDNDDLPF